MKKLGPFASESDTRYVLTGTPNCNCNESYLPFSGECTVVKKKKKNLPHMLKIFPHHKGFFFFPGHQPHKAECAKSCAFLTETGQPIYEIGNWKTVPVIVCFLTFLFFFLTCFTKWSFTSMTLCKWRTKGRKTENKQKQYKTEVIRKCGAKYYLCQYSEKLVNKWFRIVQLRANLFGHAQKLYMMSL